MYGELIPCSGGDPIPLLKRKLLVGRRSSCDISLRFPNVSSHHCEFEMVNGYWYVRDLNSRNGIKVNGVRCDSKWLMPGDVVSVSKHQYEVNYTPHGEAPTTEDEDPFAIGLLEKAGLVKRDVDDDESFDSLPQRRLAARRSNRKTQRHQQFRQRKAPVEKSMIFRSIGSSTTPTPCEDCDGRITSRGGTARNAKSSASLCRKNIGKRSPHQAVYPRRARRTADSDASLTGERVSGKGELTRRRTIIAGTTNRAGRCARRRRVEVPLGPRDQRRRAQFVRAGSPTVSYYECTVRRMLRSMARAARNIVVTGDRVLFLPIDKSTGVIERVEPRHGTVSRGSRRQRAHHCGQCRRGGDRRRRPTIRR